MTHEAHSKLWTHVASQFEGTHVYDEIFSMSSINGGKIGFQNADMASWATEFYPNRPDINLHYS